MSRRPARPGQPLTVSEAQTLLLQCQPWIYTLANRYTARGDCPQYADDLAQAVIAHEIWPRLIQGRYNPSVAKLSTYVEFVFRARARRHLHWIRGDFGPVVTRRVRVRMRSLSHDRTPEGIGSAQAALIPDPRCADPVTTLIETEERTTAQRIVREVLDTMRPNVRQEFCRRYEIEQWHGESADPARVSKERISQLVKIGRFLVARRAIAGRTAPPRRPAEVSDEAYLRARDRHGSDRDAIGLDLDLDLYSCRAIEKRIARQRRHAPSSSGATS